MKKTEMTHHYCIVYDNGPGSDGLEPDYGFTSVWDDEDIEELAEAAAEDYHHSHDGWEANWPVTFAIFNSAGGFIGKCEVQREYDPVFSASKTN